MTTLKVDLQDWTDYDLSMFQLAVALGIVEKDSFQKNKFVFWSDNPLGNMLLEALKFFSQNGILLDDEENQKFKWNEEFLI